MAAGCPPGSWPGSYWSAPGLATYSATLQELNQKVENQREVHRVQFDTRRGSDRRWSKSMLAMLERPVGTQPVANDCRRRDGNGRESEFIQAIMNMSLNIFLFFFFLCMYVILKSKRYIMFHSFFVVYTIFFLFVFVHFF